MLFLIVPVRENVKLLNGINGDVRQSVNLSVFMKRSIMTLDSLE